MREAQMKVEGYRHAPGIHCGSTAIKNIVSFLGGDFPEEILFGLGEGLSFIYVPRQDVPPYIAIHGRSLDLEEVAALRLGLDYTERMEMDPEEAWRKCRESLDRGHPVLINTDIRHLDYFGSTTHFSGHRVVLAGYDGDVALLSDSEFPEVQQVPLESLKVSRASAVPPFQMGNCMAVLTGRPDLPGADGYVEALVNCSLKMIFPGDTHTGLAGIMRAAFEMPGWYKESKTPDFVARFAYQVIEKRGTGGGFFRNLFRKFLIGISHEVPQLKSCGLIEDMGSLGRSWTSFALYMKRVSEECTQAGFVEGRERLLCLLEYEEEYHKKVLSLFT
jgi:hypothetical protein